MLLLRTSVADQAAKAERLASYQLRVAERCETPHDLSSNALPGHRREFRRLIDRKVLILGGGGHYNNYFIIATKTRTASTTIITPPKPMPYIIVG